MRTTTPLSDPPKSRRPAWPRWRSRARSRFGYDHRWWGEGPPPPADGVGSYWAVTRRPLPCLVFVGPLLLAYELGVLWIGGVEAEAWRTGADAWMRHGLAALGLTDQWFPPLCLAIALLAWQAVAAREWRFSPPMLLGMLVESVVLAVALVGLGKLVDLGFENLERAPPSLLAAHPAPAEHPLALLIGFLGAG